jgi:hypothetical protein
MNAHDEESMKQLLKRALPPMQAPDLEHDLWPTMLRRLEARPASPPWYDWVLAGSLALFAIAFPASIPVFLYYL